MKSRIVKIGNSQGIRIPKLLLERSNLAEEVELEAQDHQIIIRSTKQPRQDWEGEVDKARLVRKLGKLDKPNSRESSLGFSRDFCSIAQPNAFAPDGSIACEGQVR